MQKITFPRAKNQEKRGAVNAGSWGPEAKQHPPFPPPCPTLLGGVGGVAGCRVGAAGASQLSAFGLEHKGASLNSRPEVGLGAMRFIISHIC